MAKSTLFQPATEEQYQSMAQQYLEEMETLREQIQRERREMEAARNDTGSLLAQINALFAENKGKS